MNLIPIQCRAWAALLLALALLSGPHNVVANSETL